MDTNKPESYRLVMDEGEGQSYQVNLFFGEGEQEEARTVAGVLNLTMAYAGAPYRFRVVELD